MRGSFVAVALTLLLAGTAVLDAAAMRLIPLGRWITFSVALTSDDWSRWYSKDPWPVRYRFRCADGAVVVNAQNTSSAQQDVRVSAWDSEIAPEFEHAVDNGWAERNAGFVLPYGQATTLRVYRPQICNGSSRNFAFGVVYD